MTDRLAAIQRALDSFQMDEARALVEAELAENPSATAYYLASQAALTHGERLRYLRKTLEINPEHQVAIDELAALVPPGEITREPAEQAKPAPVKAVRRGPGAAATDGPGEKAQRGPVAEPTPQQSVPAPKPAAAVTTETRLASIGRRWLAIVIDGFIVAIATVLLLAAGGALAPLDAAIASADEAAISAAFSQFQSNTLTVNLIVSAVYNVLLMVMFNGQTLGKMMLRLRVVKKRGGRITILDAILRNVFGYMISQIFLLGYLWALFDAEKQTWHDKMASTLVVEERRAVSG